MQDFFWKVFEKSGDIEAFLAYKEYTTKDNSANNFEEGTKTI